MKTTALLIALLIVSFTYGQSSKLKGEYLNDHGYVKILNDSTLEFSYEYGGLLTKSYGYGKFIESDNKLFVTIQRPNNEQVSGMTTIGYCKEYESFSVKLKDKNGESIKGATIQLLSKKGKFIYGTNTDSLGESTIHKDELNSKKEQIVCFALVGYDTYYVPLRELKGKIVEIELSNEWFYPNSYCTFKINKSQDYLVLTGPFTKTSVSKKIGTRLRMFVRYWPWQWYFRKNYNTDTFNFRKKNKNGW